MVLASLALAVLLLAAADTAAAQSTRDKPLITTTVPGWSFRDAAMVGGINADPRETLYDVIGDVVEDPSGNFYVLNFGDQRLLSFNGNGRFRWSAGRRGQGPGEFRAPAAVHFLDDQLLVLDAAGYAVTMFDTTGQFRGTLPLDRSRGFPMSLGSGGPNAITVMYEKAAAGSAGARPLLMRMDLRTGSLAELVTLDSLVQVAARVTVDGRAATRLLSPPFAPKPQWAAAPDGTIYFGNGKEYEVFRTDRDAVRRQFHISAPQTTVTAADRTRYLESNPMARAASPPIAFPARKASFDGLRHDPRGLLWLRVPSGDGVESWEVRRPDGTLQGKVLLPAGTRIVGITAHSVFVLRRDAYDVETVHRFVRGS